MKSYLADLRILLDGCFRGLAVAFALFAASAALDLACMSVLPVFVLLALAPDAGLPASWLESILGSISATTFSIGVLLLFVLRAGFMLIVGSRMAEIAESVRERVVGRIFGELLASPYEAASRRSIPDEITAVFNYSITFSLNVVMPLLRLGLDLLTVVAALAFVATIEPQAVAVAATVFLVVGLAYFAGVRGTTARQSRRLAELQADFHRQISQALNSPREVRVYRLRQHFLGRVSENLRATRSTQSALGAIYSFPRALGELTLIGLAIAYMVFKTRAGAETALVVSNLSVLAFAGLRLLPAFAQGMTNLSYLQSGRTVTRILAGKVRLAAATPGSPDPASSGDDRGATVAEPFRSLELRRVSFRYAGAQTDALQEISLAIHRGQSVGVVGPSGAGKSTLGDLLLGLLVPRSGEILVDGRPCALDSGQWWRMAGFVPQSPYIANDTLLRNIAYGVPQAQIDRALAERALQLAQLGQVAAGLPKGVETMLGDHGVRLSGGQRQRVAIARALYRQRDFLVLDEATSALDQDTEREVIGSIDALKGTVTTFIIAHRLSTLRNCDFVVELREGRVVDVRAPSMAA